MCETIYSLAQTCIRQYGAQKLVWQVCAGSACTLQQVFNFLQGNCNNSSIISTVTSSISEEDVSTLQHSIDDHVSWINSNRII